MSLLRNIASGLRSLLEKKRAAGELDEQLYGFLAMAAEEKTKQGMTPKEALRAVRLERGTLEATKEIIHSAGWAFLLETCWQDFCYGLRALRKSPGFAVLAVLILALGIGANTAVFSVVHAVLLRPLPYNDPDRLAMLWVTDTRSVGWAVSDGSTTYRDYIEWRRQARWFEDLAVFYKRGWSVVTLSGEEPEKVQGAFVSSNFFPLMGVPPVLGRAFSEEELRRHERLIVLSYGAWQSRFGGSPQALGRKLDIDGKPWQVVGVMPPQFRFPFLAGNWENHVDGEVQLWAPLTTNPADEPPASDSLNLTRPPGKARFQVVGRLKPTVSIRTAQTEMDTIARRLAREYPDSNKTLGVHVRRLDEYIAGEMRRPLLLLLLIACTNLATLSLARGVARARELAVRAAIGATRMRLVRQLLTESALLAILAGGTGLLLAGPTVRLIVALSPVNIPRLDETRMDAAVLAFSFLLALLCSLAFGLVPARRFSAGDPHELLKTGQQSTATNTLPMQGLLVGAQFALSLVLLVNAGLLIRSFVKVLEIDPGFRPDHILTVRMLVSDPDAAPRGRIADYYQRVLERLRQIPGDRKSVV